MIRTLLSQGTFAGAGGVDTALVSPSANALLVFSVRLRKTTTPPLCSPPIYYERISTGPDVYAPLVLAWTSQFTPGISYGDAFGFENVVYSFSAPTGAVAPLMGIVECLFGGGSVDNTDWILSQYTDPVTGIPPVAGPGMSGGGGTTLRTQVTYMLPPLLVPQNESYGILSSHGGAFAASTTISGSLSIAAHSGASVAFEIRSNITLPAVTATVNCLAIGDSITLGLASSDASGYRGPLFVRLRASAINPVMYGGSLGGPASFYGATFPRNHEGHSGYAIDTDGAIPGIKPLIPSIFIGLPPLQFVFLLIGINDLGIGSNPTGAVSRLASLVDLILATIPMANGRLCLATLLPTSAANAPLLPAVIAFNAQLPALVAARPAARIKLVDLYAVFAANPDYNQWSGDGIHPNDLGYQAISYAWSQAMITVDAVTVQPGIGSSFRQSVMVDLSTTRIQVT